MLRNFSFEKPLRALFALFALAGVPTCGAASADTSFGSETHFLVRCSAECGGGLECIDGVCTRSCVDDAECTALSGAAACLPTESGSGTSSCGVACNADGDCRAENDGWTCAVTSCVAPSLGLPAPPTGSAARCPTFAGGVQEPSEAQTTFELVPGSANVEWAYADESGVYWIDFDGGIFGVKSGATSVTTFRPAPSTPGTRLGLTGDADRLYWTEAGAYPPGPIEPSPPPPPGRLMTVSKDGGPSVVDNVVESPSLVLTPLGVDASGRVFVTSSDGYLHEVTASGTLERVGNVPRLDGGLQMVDGRAYWLAYEEAGDTTVPALYAATPGGSAPVRLRQIEDDLGIVPFVAGRGVVLWAPGETRFDPLLLVQRFMMLNENTGCVQELPSVELSIGQTLLDGRHVYWQSFNALGSSSPGQPDDLVPILRVDLRTGRFDHVVTPGLEITVASGLAAQDADTLYVRQSPGNSLFAVRKPD
jgi:hypothetical protein